MLNSSVSVLFPCIASPTIAPYIDASFSDNEVGQQHLQNILVARTDRIGDVVLTIPVVEVLKANYPFARVTMLLNSYTSGLVEGIADLITYDDNGVPKSFFELLTELRVSKFDAAIVAYPRFRIGLLLWMAGIPVRIGTGYRWYSFLFNRRMYEHRKSAEKHEAEYNISLLSKLDCKLPSKPVSRIVITEKEEMAAKEVRKVLGIGENETLAILHPGSGGSARDWKPERFAELARKMRQKGLRVVITGTETESEIVRKVADSAGDGVIAYISNLNIRTFAAFLKSAKLFVANSTGPLHIAAIVGVPVIGFYPPIKVMSPVRWGPLTEKKIIFVPEVSKCARCKGGKCRGNECMDQIQVDQVLEGAGRLLTG